jgi:hypothetical protein
MTSGVEAGGVKPNEDWTGTSADTIVVLDGVTVPKGIDTGCIHGTPWYVDALGNSILETSSRRDGKDLRQVLNGAITAVRARHEDTCDTSAPGTPAATVALFRAGLQGSDYLVLSDAFLLADLGAGRIQVVTDRRLESLAVAERAEVYRLPIGTPEHTDAVLRMVRVQMALRNRSGGYWVAAADPAAADHAVAGRFAAGEVSRAAVLTDGAARLVDPFAVVDWPELLDLTAGSPADLIARTRAVEQDDPRGERWPRYKTSDDAAVAYCDLRAAPADEESPRLHSSMSSAS